MVICSVILSISLLCSSVFYLLLFLWLHNLSFLWVVRAQFTLYIRRWCQSQGLLYKQLCNLFITFSSQYFMAPPRPNILRYLFQLSNRLCRTRLGYFKSWRTFKLNHWIRRNRHFTELEIFACLWSCIGKGSARGLQQVCFYTGQGFIDKILSFFKFYSEGIEFDEIIIININCVFNG